MRYLKSVEDVVKKNMCMGCGICQVSSQAQGMRYRKQNDCYVPIIQKQTKDELANQVCPGMGYAIADTAKELFGEHANYYLNIGYVNQLYAAHSVEDRILENASSGGMITSILLYLLKHKMVDKVSVTQFVCDGAGVSTKTFLTSDPAEVLKAQGSKYCPVDLSGLLSELASFDGKVALMATPCAIAGIRNIQKYAPDRIKSQVVFCIANFCGGFKSLSNIKRLAEIHQVNYWGLKDFRFRGGGQPGSLRFVEKSGKEVGTPYPNYVGMTGYSKMLRCHLCPDATGELADIACGDAWIPKYQEDLSTWSMIICRTDSATRLVSSMQQDGVIVSESVTEQDVSQSQRLNLASKKTRQFARMKWYNFLGYSIPDYKNQGYSLNLSSIKTEMQVYVKHQLTFFAEKAGLYMVLYGNRKRK